MRKLLLAVFACLTLAAPVSADMYQDGSNAKLPEARRNLGIDTFNPVDYGAKCDSNGTTGTNDAAAINAMFAAIRTRDKPFTVTSPENRTCYVASSINATGLNTFSGHNLGIGSKITLRLDCATAGTPCVDALDSRYIKWDSLFINGLSAAPPSYGLQIGVIAPGRNADMHYFEQPVIHGEFAIAAMINVASESNIFNLPFIINLRTTGTTYGLIQDGYNHFNTTSVFVTQTVAPDTPQTFNANIIIGGWIGSGANPTGTPLWAGYIVGHRIVGGYMATGGPNCVHLYQVDYQASNDLNMDFHCETNSVVDIFRLTGAPGGSTFKLFNFHYRDYNPQPSRSVFAVDSGIAAVLATDMDIRIHGFDNGGGAAVELFNEPSKWYVSGHFMLPDPTNWSQPVYFMGGEVCFRQPVSCYPRVPTECQAGLSGTLWSNAGVLSLCP